MHLITTVFSLLFFCCLWEGEARRRIVSTHSLKNEDQRGKWLKGGFCPRGYIKGFSMKVPLRDDSSYGDEGVVGIRGHCSDGRVIPFNTRRPGTWSEDISCNGGSLETFSIQMKVPVKIVGDETPVTNIQVTCPDGTKMEGNPPEGNTYVEWNMSMSCKNGKLCGIQIKADDQTRHQLNFLNISNVKIFCCR